MCNRDHPDDVDVRSMDIWEKRCKGNKTRKKENGANEKRPKKGRILTLSKIGITKSKDHGTSIQNAGLEYFCNTYFKLEKELLIRAQYFFDKGSI